MIVIANPIYDSVFKFLMEDERVAKILLSALLQKEIVSLKMRPQEYTQHRQARISLFRIDFSAKVKDDDGTERVILIELQKTWLTTETLRFRQYLGTQYLSEKNVPDYKDNPQGYGYPIVSIYILGHKVGDITEPVVYVRRRYLDYDSDPIVNGVPDRFIESLTHDSIIVQIPYLKGNMRNRLERLLSVFDQDYCQKDNIHLIDFVGTHLTPDEQLVVSRLAQAAVTPELARDMQVEDEILSEIERRDTQIMMRDKAIQEKERVIKEKDQALRQQEEDLKQKDEIGRASCRERV